MGVRRLILVTLLVSALTACSQDDTQPTPVSGRSSGSNAGTAKPTASQGTRSPDWRRDLKALMAGIVTTHPNPWWRESRATFVARSHLLQHRLPHMTRNEAAVAIMELTAHLDGHTSVWPTDLGFHYYPLQFYEFADGVRVTRAPGTPNAVGARLVAIGHTPVSAVMRRITRVVNYDNRWSRRSYRPLFLVTAEVLAARGVVAGEHRATFVVERDDGTRLRLSPARRGWNGYQREVGWFPVGLGPVPGMVGLSHLRQAIWARRLSTGALYIGYHEISNPAGVLPVVRRAIRDPARPRVVLDLRYNGGGDNTTYGQLLSALQSRRLHGRLFVLVGRETFSAATNLAAQLERSTAATFVGEPTGGRPNLYGDVRSVLLPTSGLTVHVSSRYWPFGGPHDRRAAIPVDLAVPLTWSDLARRRDAALIAAAGTDR